MSVSLRIAGGETMHEPRPRGLRTRPVRHRAGLLLTGGIEEGDLTVLTLCRTLGVAVLMLLPIAAASGQVVITFDEIDTSAGATQVADFYAPMGVVFSDLVVNDVSDIPFFVLGPGSVYSEPNVGIVNDEPPFSLTVSATIIDPITGNDAVTDYIGFLAFDSEVGSNMMTVTVFGLAGQLLAPPLVVQTPAAQVMLVEVAVPGIHEVVLETDVDGTAIDDFAFNTPVTPPSFDFIRGDADGNGQFNGLTDGLYILNHQFTGGPPPPCMESADADSDGSFNGLADGLWLLNHQFLGGPPPAAPYPSCGSDPEPATSLGCAVSACP